MKVMIDEKEREIEQIKSETSRRSDKATKPIQKLTERFEKNGITLEIKKGLGSHNV